MYLGHMIFQVYLKCKIQLTKVTCDMNEPIQ